MEGKRGKRGKGKATGSHGRMTEKKKKKTHVINEKEEMDRLEAANVLSSLMFLPPKSSDSPESTSPVHPAQNGVADSTSTVTYISAGPGTGIPTRGSSQGPQSLSGGSGIAKSTVVTANGTAPKQHVNIQANNTILAQLNHQINFLVKNGQTHPIQLVVPNQAQTLHKSKQAAPLKGPSLQITARHADTPKLPVTVNIGQTVNRDVASALRQAVTSTNKKQIVNNGQTIPRSKPTSSPPTKTSREKDSGETLQTPISSDTLPSSSVAEGDLSHSVKKKDDSDNKLPLKKRRLVPVGEASTQGISNLDSKVDQTELIQGLSTARLSDLTSAAHIENILQMAREYSGRDQSTTAASTISMTNVMRPLDQGEGYRPVQIDPRTSLMILSDVKVALTPDQDGDLPIHIAVVHENLELVKKCIDIMAMSGKSVDRYNKLQQTPLHLAVLVNKPDIVRVLLEAGANPNLVDRHGCTALHIAVNKQFPECLHAVFDHTKEDLRLNTKNYDGYPPLHTCVDLDDLDFLEFLVHHGAFVDIQDGKAGRSALFYATEYNRVKMVEFLIDNSANADMQNYAGVTPQMVAQSGNMTDIQHILQKALDGLKISDDPQDNQIKKVQIPRIPSKSSLIVSESSFRSRSNSEDGYAPGLCVRTPSVSSCSSPIDLSFHRNTESPKDLSQARQEKVVTKSNVKEKHTQLVAALEGRNVLDRPQVRTPDTKQAILSAFTSTKHEVLTARMTASEIGVRIKKEKEDECLEVTSSSDIAMDTSVMNKVTDEEKETEEMVTDSENVVLSSDFGKALGNSESESRSKSYQGENDKDMQYSPASLSEGMSVPQKNVSTRSESIDNDMSEKDSVYTEQSPEMPVLSRMASFSNEQDSCSASIAEDVPEIDKEDLSNTSASNVTVSQADSVKLFGTQKSQESLGSSQGFETEPFMSKKTCEREMEVDGSLGSIQKSDQSDDSLEIDNTALSKVSSMDVDKENLKSEAKNIFEASESIDMDTDEEDGENPLVIDESSMENGGEVLVEGNNKVNSETEQTIVALKNGRTSTKKEFAVSKGQGRESVTENIGKSEDFKCDTVVALNSSEEKNNGISNETGGFETKIQFYKGKSESITEKHAVMSKDVADEIKDNASNQPTKAIVNSLNTQVCSPDAVLSEKTDRSGDHFCQDGSSLDKVEKNDNSDSGENSGLNSSDFLKDGKAHTLFYHDGESYKPIRIFIDNSEQSSVVLQKMLKASFTKIPPNATSQANSSSSFSDPSVSSHFKTSVIGLKPESQKKVVSHAKHIEGDSVPSKSDSEKSSASKAKETSSSSSEASLSELHKTHLPPPSTISHGSVAKVTDMLNSGRLRTDLPSREITVNVKDLFQKGYEAALSEHIKRSADEKSVSSSSVSKADTPVSKHQKVLASAGKSDRTSGDTKVMELNTPEKNIKFHIPPDMLHFIKPPVSLSMDNLTGSSSTSSLSNQSSGQVGRKPFAPRVVGAQSTTFQPGRSSASEGTLTRINPDIKSKLSMALQSSQRKLGKPKSGLGSEYEGKYPNMQELVGGTSVTSFDAVVTKTVTDSRQQL